MRCKSSNFYATDQIFFVLLPQNNSIFTLLYEKIYQILRHCRHYFRSASVRTPCHSPLQWERASFRWISTGLEWCYHICKGRAFSLIPIFKGGREGGLTGFFVKYVDVFRIVLLEVKVKHQRKT